MLLQSALRRAARFYPDNTATNFAGRKQTYREFQQRVVKLAHGLRERGIGPGDRVALYLLNCPRFIETAFACFEIGAAIVPLNTRLAADELVFILNDAECAAFITHQPLEAATPSFRNRLQGIRDYIGDGEEFFSYESLFKKEPASLSESATSEDDLAGLFYTSGTTGQPKGVMLSHRNIWMNAMHTLVARQTESNAVFLYVAPMFHLATFPAIINLTLSGGTHAILEKFDLTALMETIERERVTSTVLVPTMINFLIHHPEFHKFDSSSLCRITYGASPMPLEVLKRAMQLLPQVEFAQGYGQTESSPLLTVLSKDDHAIDASDASLQRLKSCGRPVIGVEVEVVDEDDRPLGPNQIGEVVARGPNVMLGYWKRSEETAATLRNGWLHTGDMGMFDDAGYLYLVDRKKDMIITGGENVYSTEVENILYQHPAVREAAIIGAPDEKWGEAVMAIVSLKDGAATDENDLIAFCAARLADYKVPKRIEIRSNELPKSATGKILKKELREPYWQGRERQVN
jgi:long-chain acyl-CoA synthetase